MKKDPFIDQLKTFLNEESDETSCLTIKKSIMTKISDSANIRRENAMITALNKVYKRPTKNNELKIRNLVLSEIKESKKNKQSYDLLQFGFIFARKSVALAFSFALVAVTILAPLQYTNYVSVVPLANAAFLECTGNVYLNGQACIPNEIIEIEAGDFIETWERSNATIFYTDYSVVRLAEKTHASLGEDDEDQLNVSKGEVWVNSPSESSTNTVKVTTPELKARIPKGSAGLYSKRNTTELISDSAIVEVQIDNFSGKTDIVTVSPEQGVLKVKKGTNETNVKTFELTQKQEEWVSENRQKDEKHLKEVKRKTIEDHELLAGGLPGTVPDYVGKLTYKARSAFVWDESIKTELKLSQIDELFSETLVLLEKEDETTALKNFEAYSEKFTSLFTNEFDRLSVTESEILEEKAVRLLEEHVRIVSPYTSEDKLYVLKEQVTQLTLSLDMNPSDNLAQKIKGAVTGSKIAEAHKSVSNGDIETAESLLREASVSMTVESPSETSLPLLTEIGEKSPELESIVREIKKQTVEQIKQQKIPNLSKNIETNFIKGTAYKIDSDQQDGKEESVLSSVIVGQAIKPDESQF